MRNGYYFGDVCTDCVLEIAGYDAFADRTEDSIECVGLRADYDARVSAHMAGVESVVLGHMCNENPDCVHHPDPCPDDADCDCSTTEFGTSACDRCGSPLAGRREGATFFLRPRHGLFPASAPVSNAPSDVVAATVATVQPGNPRRWRDADGRPLILRAIDYRTDRRSAPCAHCGEVIVPSGPTGASWTHADLMRRECAGDKGTLAVPELGPRN